MIFFGCHFDKKDQIENDVLKEHLKGRVKCVTISQNFNDSFKYFGGSDTSIFIEQEKTIIIYNREGYKVSETWQLSKSTNSKIIYEYDDKNHLVQTRTYEYSKNLPDRRIDVSFFYNSKGTLKKALTKEKGRKVEQQEYLYDDNGKLEIIITDNFRKKEKLVFIQKKINRVPIKILDAIIYERDKNGFVIKETRTEMDTTYKDKNIKSIIEFRNNLKGEPTLEVNCDDSGSPERILTFDYYDEDSLGNWNTQEEVDFKTGKKYITKRVIEYY